MLLKGAQSADREALESSELNGRGLQEQMKAIREQRDYYEQQIVAQQAQLGEMEARIDAQKKQAQDTLTRTEMELQRLQRKVKKLTGDQTSQPGLIQREEMQLLLDDESQVDDFTTSLCSHRLSP